MSEHGSDGTTKNGFWGDGSALGHKKRDVNPISLFWSGKLALQATVYHTWLDRNARIYGGKGLRHEADLLQAL